VEEHGVIDSSFMKETKLSSVSYGGGKRPGQIKIQRNCK